MNFGLFSESKVCECVCQRTETGECVCICDAPCAYDAETKMKEWVCTCNLGPKVVCQCKFALKCNRKEGQCPSERDVFVCKCKCDAGECTFQIRKCVCCEIIRTECGTCASMSSEQTEEIMGKQQTEGSCCGGRQ